MRRGLFKIQLVQTLAVHTRMYVHMRMCYGTALAGVRILSQCAASGKLRGKPENRGLTESCTASCIRACKEKGVQLRRG